MKTRTLGRRLVFCTVLLLLVGGASAQHAGLNLQLESVRPQSIGADAFQALQPVDSPLESILYDKEHDWANDKKIDRELYKFNVEWGTGDTVAVKRNLSQRAVDGLKGRPFERGVKWHTEQSVTLTPFAGTSLSYGEQTNETVDAANISLGATQAQTMGLKQSFGGGLSGGTVDFSRTVTKNLKPSEEDPFAAMALTNTKVNENLALTQGFSMLGQGASFEYKRDLTSTGTPGEYAKTQATEGVKLAMPLWGNTNFSAQYLRSHSNQEMGLHQQTKGMSFARKFSSGDAAVSYLTDVKRVKNNTTETTTQALKVPFRFDGTVFAAAYDAKTVQVNDKLMSEARSANFATKVGGNDVTGSWSRNMVCKGGKDQQTTKMAFSLPINFYDDKITFNFASDGTQSDTTVVKKQRTAALAVPLSHFQKGARFDYVVKGLQKKAGQPFTETRTAKLIMPLTMLDTLVQSEFQKITTRQNGKQTVQYVGQAAFPVQMFGQKIDTWNQYVAVNRPDGTEQDQIHTRVTVPTKPGPLVMQRRTITTTAVNGEARRTRIMNVVSPRVPLHALVSLQADMERKGLPDGVDQRTDHLNLQAKPMRAMVVNADYRVRDLGNDDKTKDRQLDWAYQLSPRLDLNARYLEREQLDRSPFIQRTMVVQHKNQKPSDLRMKAALTSTDTGVVNGDLFKLVDLGVGDPKKLGLSLRYQEYDEKKLTGLGDPIIRFGLQSGDPSSVHWVFGYEDCKGRAEPHRMYSVGLPVGDTTLKLGFSQNAVDPMSPPKKKVVRLADAYDASVSRKVFSDVDLSVGYRYLQFDDDAPGAQRTDQFLQMNVKGGKAEGGGALTLAYRSGDFATLNAKKPHLTPESELEFSYNKKWTDTSELVLSLNRKLVPDAAKDAADGYQGSIRFNKQWTDSGMLTFELARTKLPFSKETLKDGYEGTVQFNYEF